MSNDTEASGIESQIYPYVRHTAVAAIALLTAACGHAPPSTVGDTAIAKPGLVDIGPKCVRLGVASAAIDEVLRDGSEADKSAAMDVRARVIEVVGGEGCSATPPLVYAAQSLDHAADAMKRTGQAGQTINMPGKGDTLLKIEPNGAITITHKNGARTKFQTGYKI